MMTKEKYLAIYDLGMNFHLVTEIVGVQVSLYCYNQQK